MPTAPLRKSPTAPTTAAAMRPAGPAPAAAPRAARQFAFGEVVTATAQRIGIYGPGGIGKTSLACHAPGPVALFDLDNSLPVLKPTLSGLDIKVVQDVITWQDMRDALHSKMWDGIKTIVVDSLTRGEQLGIAHTLATVRNEKGYAVSSLEGYGFGKGMRHSFETMLSLLGDLDQHVREGRNAVLICHDVTANVPNPAGDDYIRYEPRLQNANNGNLRLSAKEWLDHLIYIGYDIAVDSDGKAKGSGTRTLYPVETPIFLAKSRSLREPMVYEDGSDEVWKKIFQA